MNTLITPIDRWRSRGDGPLVLFLPGMSGNERQWDLVVPGLNDITARRAYGAPILPHPCFGYHAPTVARLARTTADELSGSRCTGVVIVSHSVGAFVALGVARLLPGDVSRVILVNGGLTGVARFIDDPVREFVTRPGACLSYLKLFMIVGVPVSDPLKKAIASRRWCTRLVAGSLVSRAGVRSQAQRTALLEEAGGPEVLRALLYNRHHWPEFVGSACSINTPVTFIVGGRDPIATEDDARAMAALLPYASVRTVSAAAHSIPLEYPGVVIEEVRDAVTQAR